VTLHSFFTLRKCSSLEKIAVLQYLALLQKKPLDHYFVWWDQENP